MAVAFDIRGLPPPRPLLKEAAQAPASPPSALIHARCAQKISRHIARVMGSDYEHEDLVQEVLVTVVRKLDTLRDPRCFEAWVAQITANTLKVTMRQRRLRRQTLGTLGDNQGDGLVHTDYEARYVAERAMRVVERLSESEREILVAQWFAPSTREGFAASLAAKNGCSVATAQRRLSRARARFEKLARRDPVLAPRLADASEASEG